MDLATRSRLVRTAPGTLQCRHALRVQRMGCGPGRQRGDTLLERWNGTSWVRRTPVAASGLSNASRVSAGSPSDVWVVVNDHGHDVLMHFDGVYWSVHALPGTRHAAFVRDVTSLPAGQMFAVGGTGTGRTYAIDRCVG